MKDEAEELERFIDAVGGSVRANKLQSIWNNSYPHSTSNIFREVTKEDDFRRQAKAEGFTDLQIDMFLRL